MLCAQIAFFGTAAYIGVLEVVNQSRTIPSWQELKLWRCMWHSLLFWAAFLILCKSIFFSIAFMSDTVTYINPNSLQGTDFSNLRLLECQSSLCPRGNLLFSWKFTCDIRCPHSCPFVHERNSKRLSYGHRYYHPSCWIKYGRHSSNPRPSAILFSCWRNSHHHSIPHRFTRFISFINFYCSTNTRALLSLGSAAISRE